MPAMSQLPIVLVHAFPLSSSMYDPLRTALPSGVDILTPELPGFGGNPLSDAEPSLDVYADSVAAFLDDRGIDRAVVGGTSMGGYTTMALCRRHRDRVAGLLLIDTKATADVEAAADGRRVMADRLVAEAGTGALLEAVLPKLLGATTFASRPDVVAGVRAGVESCDPAAAAWAQRAMAARPDSLPTLREMGVPALVVVGEEDVLAPPSDALAMVDALPDALMVVVPSVGHLTPLEAPDQVAAAIADFITYRGSG